MHTHAHALVHMHPREAVQKGSPIRLARSPPRAVECRQLHHRAKTPMVPLCCMCVRACARVSALVRACVYSVVSSVHVGRSLPPHPTTPWAGAACTQEAHGHTVANACEHVRSHACTRTRSRTYLAAQRHGMLLCPVRILNTKCVLERAWLCVRTCAVFFWGVHVAVSL